MVSVEDPASAAGRKPEAASAPEQSAAALPPRPVAPPTPDINDCCGNGCDPCIFDLHAEAMARYRAELKAWQALAGETADAGTGNPSF
ncbi:oxidoreductase-like domain-containing protein [Cupriavidus basilensis]|uniref:Oxidoreductase-like domain-containing protein n=1 Tax=Cupriavidus basilensis TaxID=68895 RepID=A0ABT6AGC1_9BURK|nr:oxidoreductase-like domain-containing protein [Cupriavidus basilensis]MDF3831372.1 oxidoreductase-like domain-containing protein [Cupriavidus basilensis]